MPGTGSNLSAVKPRFDDRFRLGGVFVRLLDFVTPAVGVNADLVPHRPAEQIVDRLFRGLAADVPQRLLDARGGAIELKRSAALRIVVESDLQDMPDLEGIASNQVAAELFDLRGDGAVAIILAVRLAPADDAGIGLDADEHKILSPAAEHRMARHLADFHKRSFDESASISNAVSRPCGGAALAGVGPVAAQEQAVFLGRVAIGEPFTDETNIDVE